MSEGTVTYYKCDKDNMFWFEKDGKYMMKVSQGILKNAFVKARLEDSVSAGHLVFGGNKETPAGKRITATSTFIANYYQKIDARFLAKLGKLQSKGMSDEQRKVVSDYIKYTVAKELKFEDTKLTLDTGRNDLKDGYWQKKLNKLKELGTNGEWFIDRIEHKLFVGNSDDFACELEHKNLKKLFVARDKKTGKEIKFGSSCIKDFFFVDAAMEKFLTNLSGAWEGIWFSYLLQVAGANKRHLAVDKVSLLSYLVFSGNQNDIDFSKTDYKELFDQLEHTKKLAFLEAKKFSDVNLPIPTPLLEELAETLDAMPSTTRVHRGSFSSFVFKKPFPGFKVSLGKSLYSGRFSYVDDTFISIKGNLLPLSDIADEDTMGLFYGKVPSRINNYGLLAAVDKTPEKGASPTIARNLSTPAFSSTILRWTLEDSVEHIAHAERILKELVNKHSERNFNFVGFASEEFLFSATNIKAEQQTFTIKREVLRAILGIGDTEKHQRLLPMVDAIKVLEKVLFSSELGQSLYDFFEQTQTQLDKYKDLFEALPLLKEKSYNRITKDGNPVSAYYEQLPDELQDYIVETHLSHYSIKELNDTLVKLGYLKEPISELTMPGATGYLNPKTNEYEKMPYVVAAMCFQNRSQVVSLFDMQSNRLALEFQDRTDLAAYQWLKEKVEELGYKEDVPGKDAVGMVRALDLSRMNGRHKVPLQALFDTLDTSSASKMALDIAGTIKKSFLDAEIPHTTRPSDNQLYHLKKDNVFNLDEALSKLDRELDKMYLLAFMGEAIKTN